MNTRLADVPVPVPAEQPARGLERVGWQDEAAAAFLGKQAVGAPEKAIDRFHVERWDKVRQVLQLHFERFGPATYGLAEAV